MMREKEILGAAIAAFERETNIQVEETPLGQRQADREIDAILRMNLPQGLTQYWVEVKRAVTNTAVGQIAHQFGEDRIKWLLVTRHILPGIAATMRELGLQFIDTVGNAYINNPPALIFIQTNKRPTNGYAEREDGILGRAGIKLVFALLCKRDLLNAPYRDMAEAANVALGTAAGIIKKFMRQGYLVEIGEQRRLNRVVELLNKWTTAYAEKLRPNTLIGRYTAPRPDFWRDADIDRFGALWGGETAAHWLTHYLKPEITTIYAKKPINDLLLNLKLRKTDEGDVVVRERFWEFDNGGPDKNLVPPLLVYTDLLATGDARNIETAKMVYEEYLSRMLKEN